MGEVYRARDTRLGREVAIKVLPAALSSDAERLKRFEKESRSASSLNHPNIVTVYDIGAQDGVSYLAMELVSGETLRGLVSGGALPIKKLLAIAPQIAEGLAKAHEAGIVHRDLKPENVMVTKDGLVKILDFGLAKLTSTMSGSDEGSNLPTMTGTTPGVVVGTVGYMSPEQASGQTVDFRSDQFSFGSMLYEMATGKRAFQKKTPIDTLGAILNEEPEAIATASPQTPAPFRWIVERCLAKEPDGRYASTKDLTRDLAGLRDHLPEAHSASLPVATRRLLPYRWPLIVGAVSLVAAGVGIDRWFAFARRQANVPVFQQLTFRRGTIIGGRFAPDGRTVVYSAAWDGKPADVYSVRTDSHESRPLGLPGAEALSVSSKGEIAILLKVADRPLVRSGTLARIPIGGGTPREILEDVSAADWSPNGDDLAVAHVLPGARIEIQYPIGTVLKELPSFGGVLRVSPSGELVAITTDNTISTLDRKGNQRVISRGWTEIAGAAWSPRGDEILLAAGHAPNAPAIWAVSLSGRERVVANLVPQSVLLDAAPDGRLLVQLQSGRHLMICKARGETDERELSWLDGSFPMGLSEDGRQVLFGDWSDPDSIFLRKTDGSPPIRVGYGGALALSPDGRWVLATSKGELLLLPTGTGIARKITVSGLQPVGADLLPRDKGVLVLAFDQHRNPILATVGLDGGTPTPVRADSFDAEKNVAFSPEGDRYAYVGKDNLIRVGSFGGADAAKIPASPLEEKEDVIQWSDDGRFLYVNSSDYVNARTRIDRVEIATGRREDWKTLKAADPTGVYGIGTPRLSRDGESYAYWIYRAVKSDLFVLEGTR
jgi:WD40 repeat protein